MARGRPGGLRVLGGVARGVTLRGPRDGRTRPTAARLRESLFGMLDSADDDMSEVIDLYAGTGALGIEALSRARGRCTFVEADAGACRVIRENLRRVHCDDRAVVVRARVGHWRAPPEAAYTLVLADAPYDDADAWSEIKRSIGGALAQHAVLAVEHPARERPPPALLGRAMWRDRRQGDGAVAVYRPAQGKDVE